MSKSILVNEYNKSNMIHQDIRCFYQTINVSILDILHENEVNVDIKDYKDCLCKDSKHYKDYFCECSKCEGKGSLVINNHEVICNECRGEKFIRIHDCYLCDNEGKILKNGQIKLKLNNKIKQDEEIKVDFNEYSLVLKVNIYDYKDYVVKSNDIYYLNSVYYSKEDFINKVNKVIYTGVNNNYLSSEFKVKKEIVKIDNQGINGGDFYFIFENEVENEKKIKYVNLLIDKCGYIRVSDLIDNEIVSCKDNIALNDKNYFYVDSDTKEYEDDYYLIKFNRLNKNDFIVEDNKIVYILKLNKEDSENDKKSLIINGDKINISYKKNLKEEIYVKINDKVVVNSEGKKSDLIIKVIPYFENVYKISIKKNKNVVYVEDYKHDDYTLVETFKRENYLEDYISINDEDRIVVNNDLIFIKRV